MLDPALCPIHLRESIDRYVNEGVPVGSFLSAVLANNLEASVTRADEANVILLPHIVAYVIQNVPFNVWGSEFKVDRYIEKKERERMRAQAVQS